jgi:hypothetical protein
VFAVGVASKFFDARDQLIFLDVQIEKAAPRGARLRLE